MEREIADGLARRLGHPGADSETASAMERFRAVVNTHADALAQHVEKYSGQMASPRAPFPWTDAPHQCDANRTLSSVLPECHVAFTHAVAAYSMLFETALRLYLPPLRTLSTQHLKAHAINAHRTNALAVRAVARELEENGLHCSCVGPMCGMGACACVATGAGALAMPGTKRARRLESARASFSNDRVPTANSPRPTSSQGIGSPPSTGCQSARYRKSRPQSVNTN